MLAICCKKNNDNDLLKKRNLKSYSITMDFPDTVFIHKGYDGKINYKNALDTVTTKLLDINRLRFIEYGFLKTNIANLDKKYVKKNMTDTFISKTNRIIPLYNIYFDKLGVNFIDGIITDEVRIDSIMLRDGTMQPSTRIITNDFRVTKEVFVIENPNKK